MFLEQCINILLILRNRLLRSLWFEAAILLFVSLLVCDSLDAFTALGSSHLICVIIKVLFDVSIASLVVFTIHKLDLLTLLGQLLQQLLDCHFLVASNHDVLACAGPVQIFINFLNGEGASVLEHGLKLSDLVFVLFKQSILGVFVDNWLVLNGLSPCGVPKRGQRLLVVVVGRRQSCDHDCLCISSERVLKQPGELGVSVRNVARLSIHKS